MCRLVVLSLCSDRLFSVRWISEGGGGGVSARNFFRAAPPLSELLEQASDNPNCQSDVCWMKQL